MRLLSMPRSPAIHHHPQGPDRRNSYFCRHARTYCCELPRCMLVAGARCSMEGQSAHLGHILPKPFTPHNNVFSQVHLRNSVQLWATHIGTWACTWHAGERRSSQRSQICCAAWGS